MTRLNATMALVVALCALLISCAQPSSLTSGTTSSTTLALTSISPSDADAGGGALTLTAAGASFGSTAMIMWNGASRATTVVNSTTVSASISSTDLANEGDVTVAVKDAKSGATTNALHFRIRPKKRTLAVTTTSLVGATVATAYQASLVATGGTTPYAWSIASGQLPSGMSLSS